MGAQRRRRRQAFGEEDHRLAARQLVEGLQDREQRLGGHVAALIAVHRVERLQHPHLALDEAQLQVGLADARGAASRRRAALLRALHLRHLRLEQRAPIAHLVHRFALLLLRLGPGRDDLADGGADERRVVGIDLEGADERLGREDADAGGAVAAHRQVLEGGLLAHPDGFGRERVEDERGDRRIFVVVERRRVPRRRPGRRRHDGGRIGIAQPHVDGDAGAARHARERPDLLDDIVLSQLEVLRPEVGDRLAVLAPDDDVDEHRGRGGRELAPLVRRRGHGPHGLRGPGTLRPGHLCGPGRLWGPGALCLREGRGSGQSERDGDGGSSGHHGTSLKVTPRVADTDPWRTETRSS